MVFPPLFSIAALPFQTCTDLTEEALLDLDMHVKNSTLLDASHAVSIHMHQPPNLSNITGNTVTNTHTVPYEKKNPKTISHLSISNIKILLGYFATIRYDLKWPQFVMLPVRSIRLFTLITVPYKKKNATLLDFM